VAGPTRWGTFDWLDAARQPLPWPERLLFVGPPGLGDTLAALPFLRRIRRESPCTHVTWMARAELRPILEMMGVDGFEVHDASGAFEPRRFQAIVSSADPDAAFFGGIAGLNEVPVRIGPRRARARPLVWNHLVRMVRLGRPRHESQRYLRLLLPFGSGAPAGPAELYRSAHLAPAPVALPDGIAASGAVVLHPFSMGNGREGPLVHWIDLARRLTDAGVPVVFTGSAAEGERLAAAWPARQRPAGVADAFGRLTLAQLSTLLGRARAMAASSTGPLHLSAALGTPTLGLYAPRRGLATDRWAALGRAATSVQALRHCPRRRCQNERCHCMDLLAPQSVAQSLQTHPGQGLELDPLAPYFIASPCAANLPTHTQPTLEST
jgi:ADP-heptose:LPS heptosyltransferase